MFIVDAHEDIAYNALYNGRDVRRSIAETRAYERQHPLAETNPFTSSPQLGMLGLPEHRRGSVGLVFATIYVPPGEPRAMTAAGRAQVQYYADLAAQGIGVRLINTRAQLATLLHDWSAAAEPDARPVGFVLLMEAPIRCARHGT